MTPVTLSQLVDAALRGMAPLRICASMGPAVEQYGWRELDKKSRTRFDGYRKSLVGVEPDGLLRPGGWHREGSGRIHVRAQAIANTLRRHVIPSEAERVFIDVDYSSAHMLIAAVRSGDNALIGALAAGDVYAALGSATLPDAPDREAVREAMKLAALSMLNGAGVAKIARLVDGLTLTPKATACALVKYWRATYPDLHRYVVATLKAATASGGSFVVVTLTGREVSVYGGRLTALAAHWSSVEAEALDYALAGLQDTVGAYGARLVLPMFDGLLLDAPVAAAPAVAVAVEALMVRAMADAGVRGAGVKVAIQPQWGKAASEPKESNQGGPMLRQDGQRDTASPRDDDKPHAEATNGAPPAPDHRLNDLGNARMFVERFGVDLRSCSQLSGPPWLVWTGARWQPDDTRQVDRYAAAVGDLWRAQAPPQPSGRPAAWGDEEKAAAKARALILAHALRSESAKGMRDMLTVAGADIGIVTTRAQYDASPHLFNTPAGTFDLERGTVHEPRRADLLMKQAGTSASAADVASCPTWLAFLTRIMGGDADPDGAAEMVAYLQRVLGYCLSGSTKERCFWILWGESGDNGKTTLLSVLRHVMGDYAVSTRAQTFMVDRRGGGIPNDVAALVGARVVTASEPPENTPLNEALIKELTGGEDTITARFMRAEFFTFVATFKVFLACNKRPRIEGTDDSIWRRPRLIPFNVTIPKAEQDPDLVGKLRAEAPGILRWMLNGWKEYRRMGGLADPETVYAARDDWRTGEDPMAMFLAECCDVGKDNGPTAMSDLYAAYQRWAGGHARGKKWFGGELNRKHFKEDPRHDLGRRRIGIALKTL